MSAVTVRVDETKSPTGRPFDMTVIEQMVTGEQRRAHLTSESCSYSDLQFSLEQVQATRDLVSMLAGNSFYILAQSISLINKGKMLYGSHPFKQLSSIVMDNQSKKYFKVIYDGAYMNKYSAAYNAIAKQYFNGFVTVLKDRIKGYGLDVHDHIDAFALEIGSDRGTIRSVIEACIKANNWKAFFFHLSSYEKA